MKLLIEKHPEIDRLSYCFEKIERVAEYFGIHVDELDMNSESGQTNNLKGRMQGISAHRKVTFLNQSRQDHSNAPSPLRVYHLNKDLSRK